MADVYILHLEVIWNPNQGLNLTAFCPPLYTKLMFCRACLKMSATEELALAYKKGQICSGVCYRFQGFITGAYNLWMFISLIRCKIWIGRNLVIFTETVPLKKKTLKASKWWSDLSFVHYILFSVWEKDLIFLMNPAHCLLHYRGF